MGRFGHRERRSIHARAGIVASTTLAMLFVAAIAAAPPAAAHDELIASEPAASAQLVAAPTSVTLSFNNPPLPIGATVIVVDADGADWVDGAPSGTGTSMVTTLRPGMPEGNYQVRWRVVSADGAVVSGFYGFSVGDSSDAPAVPSPRRSVPAGDRSELGDFALTPVGSSAEVAPPDGHRSLLRTVLIGVAGALAGIGLFVVATVVLQSDRARRPVPTHSSTPVTEPADVPRKDAQP